MGKEGEMGNIYNSANNKKEVMHRQYIGQFLALSITIATAILLLTRTIGTKPSLLQTNIIGPLAIIFLKCFPDHLLF